LPEGSALRAAWWLRYLSSTQSGRTRRRLYTFDGDVNSVCAVRAGPWANLWSNGRRVLRQELLDPDTRRGQCISGLPLEDELTVWQQPRHFL
jgi:hypothetical protein